jgi:hypothetical protein
MSVAVGNRVRVKLAITASVGVAVQPQPPTIGIATRKVATTIDAAFAGKSINVDETHLEAITESDVTVRGIYIDKVVTGIIAAATATKPLVPYVSEFTGRIVDVYNVDAAPRMLVRALSNGMYYELPLASVHILEDR